MRVVPLLYQTSQSYIVYITSTIYIYTYKRVRERAAIDVWGPCVPPIYHPICDMWLGQGGGTLLGACLRAVYIWGYASARARRAAAAAMASKMDESRWTLAGAHWTFGAVFPSSLFSVFLFFFSLLLQ
jgi:hypothetical protein